MVEGEVYLTVTKTNIHQPQKVMIWGAIGINSKSDCLLIISKSAKFHVYIDRAINGLDLKQMGDFTYGVGNYLFQQTNVGRNTSNFTNFHLNQIRLRLSALLACSFTKFIAHRDHMGINRPES